MRRVVCLLACAAMLAGCATGKSSHESGKTNEPHRRLIVTEAPVLIGKVVSVRSDLGVAVLNFPVGSLPGMDQRLNAYRQGSKVGEIKVTGPQQDDNTVGDIVSGQVLPGDEVRED